MTTETLQDILSSAAGKLAGRKSVTFLPDPEPRERNHPLVSVDDHFVEPRDMFEGRLPARLVEKAPRVVEDDDGTEWWLFEDERVCNDLSSTIVGRPLSEWSFEPLRFDEMRRAVWDIHERVRDMDLVGIHAQQCFPSHIIGFTGRRFLSFKDRDLGLACIRAYNDWVIEEWSAPYPERVIPQQVAWLHDPELAADDIRRNAARGFKAVSLSENPEKLGFPSIYSDYWEPIYRACEETGTVVNLHIGSSATTVRPSSESPIDVPTLLFPANGMMAAVDWLYAGVPVRYPDLKIVFSEAGIGWVPMMLERLERNHRRNELLRGWTAEDVTPVEVFRRNYWFSVLEEPAIFELRDMIGVDRIMLETDYPHPDTTWPDVQATIDLQMQGLPQDEVDRFVFRNACELYRHPEPAAPAATGPAAHTTA